RDRGPVRRGAVGRWRDPAHPRDEPALPGAGEGLERTAALHAGASRPVARSSARWSCRSFTEGMMEVCCGESRMTDAAPRLERAHAKGTTLPWPAIAFSALALTWCTGCPQMAITTAATTAASAIVDDRSLEQQGADLDVKTRIEKQLLADAPKVAERVNVDVYLGRVMLTGVLGRRSERRTALAVVGTVE